MVLSAIALIIGSLCSQGFFYCTDFKHFLKSILKLQKGSTTLTLTQRALLKVNHGPNNWMARQNIQKVIMISEELNKYCSANLDTSWIQLLNYTASFKYWCWCTSLSFNSARATETWIAGQKTRQTVFRRAIYRCQFQLLRCLRAGATSVQFVVASAFFSLSNFLPSF